MKGTEKNIFVFGLQSQMDVQNALQKNLWSYGPFLLIVQEYQYGVAPETVNMDIVTMWARFLNLPPELTIEPIPYEIARSMATCLMVEYPSRSELTLTCPRALVEINVNERLWDNIPVNRGKLEKLRVNLFFEKLLKGFCKQCRILNHPRKKCIFKNPKVVLIEHQLEEMMEIEEEARFVEEQLEGIADAFREENTEENIHPTSKSFILGETSNNQALVMVNDKGKAVAKTAEVVIAKASFKVGVPLHESMFDSDVSASKRHTAEEIESETAPKLQRSDSAVKRGETKEL